MSKSLQRKNIGHMDAIASKVADALGVIRRAADAQRSLLQLSTELKGRSVQAVMTSKLTALFEENKLSSRQRKLVSSAMRSLFESAWHGDNTLDVLENKQLREWAKDAGVDNFYLIEHMSSLDDDDDTDKLDVCGIVLASLRAAPSTPEIDETLDILVRVLAMAAATAKLVASEATLEVAMRYLLSQRAARAATAAAKESNAIDEAAEARAAEEAIAERELPATLRHAQLEECARYAARAVFELASKGAPFTSDMAAALDRYNAARIFVEDGDEEVPIENKKKRAKVED